MVVFKTDSKNNNHIAHKDGFFILTRLFSSHFLFSICFHALSCNVFGASPFLVLVSLKWRFWESFC